MSKLRFMHRTEERLGGSGPEGVCESYILYIPGVGAVEAWREKLPEGYTWPRSGYIGSIELHYHKNPGDEVYIPNCTVLGGECYTDGSSSAFESIAEHFDNPELIRDELIRWAKSRGMTDGEVQA